MSVHFVGYFCPICVRFFPESQVTQGCHRLVTFEVTHDDVRAERRESWHPVVKHYTPTPEDTAVGALDPL